MSTNTVEIEGHVKWEPKVFEARKEGQKPIMVFALEYTGKSERRSVFHFKAFGDLVDTLQQEDLAQGDRILVSGRLNEAKWQNKQTEEWQSRIEIWANKVEFVERVGSSSSPEDDEIPF